MEYKQIEFKQFLDTNNIQQKDLPEPIQEKIDIFYRLYELQDRIQDPDLQELMEQIEELDVEILEDIEEEFEDQLANNELTEVEVPTNTIVKRIKPKKITQTKSSDERILEELVGMGMTKGISRSKLYDMGLQTKLGRSTIIGNFVLKRVSFLYFRYDIIPRKPMTSNK